MIEVPSVPLPRMIRVRQQLTSAPLADVTGRVRTETASALARSDFRPGQSVAVSCSSRGLDNYPQIVAGLIAELKTAGLDPFVIPAMGSHGSATAEGQAAILAHLGLTEAAVGAPIRSSMEVERIGETEDGLDVFVDALALAADHIVLVNRIKKHTEMFHEFESGLLKLMAIGLGKQAGAAYYHRAMLTHGYPRVILTSARTVLATGRVLFGLGVIEDAFCATSAVGAFLPDEIEAREKEFLARASAISPKLPFDDFDVVFIDEMGKEISGSGFDTKVVGRIGLPLVTPDPPKPKVKRIVISDLTAASDGNAVGVGVADLITDRLAGKIDMAALAMNTVTGVCPEMGKVPMSLASDRDALRLASVCVGLTPPEKLKVVRIKNTLALEEVEVSEAFARLIESRDDLTALSPAREMDFGPDGYFKPFTPYGDRR